ncbi:hypothetical protein Acr_03g0003780 [Actinidia rufa]|uniref:Uncharacterized protein n=1 Tax=Actinidia rufa TaxID=165716 RepID=A0A7J0EAT2_9ERIC|nr:hypothetical protein Acr_03g0003780 [Actinidia rufa]
MESDTILAPNQTMESSEIPSSSLDQHSFHTKLDLPNPKTSADPNLISLNPPNPLSHHGRAESHPQESCGRVDHQTRGRTNAQNHGRLDGGRDYNELSTMASKRSRSPLSQRASVVYFADDPAAAESKSSDPMGCLSSVTSFSKYFSMKMIVRK